MDEFFEKLGKVTFGVVISGAAGLLMNIMLGRFLTSSEYGVFRVFFSSVLMIGGFLSFGLERRTASLLARKDHGSGIVSRMTGMVLILITLLFVTSIILQHYLASFLGGKKLFLSFVVSTCLYIIYKYSMGVFKGLRREEYIGIQNITIGVLKIALVLVVFFLAYAAAEISVLISIVYLSMVLTSLWWLRNNLDMFYPRKPDAKDFKSVILSNSKQVGAVIVLFSAPIIVDLIGGNSTQAGIMGAVFTLSLIPYYVYRALMHVILPEISDLKSKDDIDSISSRIGLFTWITLIGIIFWSFTGYFLGPRILELVFGSGFEIMAIQSFLIFMTSSIFLLASLFTEVLIGLGGERDIAKFWIIPSISFLILLFPFNPITITAGSMLIYISISTFLLSLSVVGNGVKIWKLDLSNIPWKKLH